MKKRDVMKGISILIIATFVAIGLSRLGFAKENMMMIYTVAVLLISIETKGYIVGIVSSIVAMLCCNFLFIQPQFNFSVYDSSYSVTIIIVALVTTMLTTRIQLQARLCAKREEDTQMLYEISNSFLNLSGEENIIRHGVERLSKGLEQEIIYYRVIDGEIVQKPYRISHSDESIQMAEGNLQIIEEIVKNGQEKDNYIPIKGQSNVMGVIGLGAEAEKRDRETRRFIYAVIAQMALALERERLAKQQEISKIEIERERLRSNLLRAISHDLRTPLTGISGASHILINNKNQLEDIKQRELLEGIYEDAEWLIRLVENLLSMTRIDEGGLKIHKNFELVEEIVGEAVRHIRKRENRHVLKVSIPEDYILIEVDGKLIEQVIINLIDNAFKYTSEKSIVELEVWEEKNQIVWVVRDNGKGIMEEDLPHIFERFYTGVRGSTDSKRCVGLGLAICKSIIEAHEGEISVNNRSEGGAEFRFVLPKSKENSKEKMI